MDHNYTNTVKADLESNEENRATQTEQDPTENTELPKNRGVNQKQDSANIGQSSGSSRLDQSESFTSHLDFMPKPGEETQDEQEHRGMVSFSGMSSHDSSRMGSRGIEQDRKHFESSAEHSYSNMGGLGEGFSHQGADMYNSMSSGMFPDSEVIPGMTQHNLNNFPFSGENNFPYQFSDMGGTQEESLYELAHMRNAGGPSEMQMMHPDFPAMYQDYGLMPSSSDYGMSQEFTSDEKLRPARMSAQTLQKELSSRNLPYVEGDKVANIGQLVNYLVDRDYGESELSSCPEDIDDFESDVEQMPVSRHPYSYLEVILINCEHQRKPLIDWLETWKKASERVSYVDIFELTDNNLIKIRIYNRLPEPSGVVEQLNSVKIKCARYFSYTNGENWGGWEYYEDGAIKKREMYNNEHHPPLFWKRLCWLENLSQERLGDISDFENADGRNLSPEQVCLALGTTEEMICVDCGTNMKTCAKVHGSFNGQFKNKDLYNRYASLVL